MVLTRHTAEVLEGIKVASHSRRNVTVGPGDAALTECGRCPVLNGAHGARALSWPGERPWSPIVRKETESKGMDWYVHEDGSKSITQMAHDSAVGRDVAVTSTYNPAPTLPMAPDELAEVQKEMAKQGKDKNAGGTPKLPPPKNVTVKKK